MKINSFIKRIGFGYLITVFLFTAVIFFSSLWITIFLYEPSQDSYDYFAHSFYTFIILFVPLESIAIGIVTTAKFSIDAFNKKEGANLRFVIVVIMILLTVIPSIFVTYISIAIIKSNLDITLSQNIDDSLVTLIEYSREKINDKQKDMSRIISFVGNRNFQRITLSTNLIDKQDYFENLTIISNDSGINDILISRGSGATVNLTTLFTNDSIMFINNEYDNKFYVNAVIPFMRSRANSKSKPHYAIWTEQMPDDFIKERNNALGAFRLYRSVDVFRNEYSAILTVLYIFILGISSFFSLIFAIILSKLITNPISNILNASNHIIGGDFNINLKLRGLRDMRNLMHQFNVMVRSLRYLREKEASRARLETWREAAIIVAHEIKNPLTPIIMNAELISRKMNKDIDETEKEKIKSYSDIIIRNSMVISKLVKSFSEFSFTINITNDKKSINTLLANSVESFLNNENIHIQFHLTKFDYLIKMDSEKLSIAFNNLITNAFEAIYPKEKGDIFITTYHDYINENLYFCISITDTGIGISDFVLNKIFEPYYTSKENGTGIGLSLVEKIIMEHGGTIDVESIEGEGSRFFIKFKRD